MPSNRPNAHVSEESVERTRRKLLDAAQRLVERHGGVSVSLDLTMEQVMAEAGVSRSTMYRTWPNKGAFEVDVLTDLAGPSWQGTAAFDAETIALAYSVIADRLHDLQTLEGRERAMREAIRQAAQRNFEAVIHSPQWRTYVALTATAKTLAEAECRIAVLEALVAAERNFLGKMAQFYQGMADVLGFRLRNPDFTYEQLAAVGAAVVEGMGLRQVIAGEHTGRPVTIEGPDGPEDWNLAALGFYGLVTNLIEPDPDYDFQTALAKHLKGLSTLDPS